MNQIEDIIPKWSDYHSNGKGVYHVSETLLNDGLALQNGNISSGHIDEVQNDNHVCDKEDQKKYGADH